MTLNLWKSLRFVSAVLIWLNGVKDSLAGVAGPFDTNFWLRTTDH